MAVVDTNNPQELPEATAALKDAKIRCPKKITYMFAFQKLLRAAGVLLT